MEQAAIIQEIHARFEEQPNAAQLLEYKPDGITDAAFVRLADHYRLRYPQNNFITEIQVGEICKKYGLLLGPDILFSGTVPVHNSRQIEGFKLLAQDRHGKNSETIFKTLERIQEAGAAVTVYTGSDVESGATAELEARYYSDGFKMSVIPFGGQLFFVLYASQAGIRATLFQNVEHLGSFWLVRLADYDTSDEGRVFRVFHEMQPTFMRVTRPRIVANVRACISLDVLMKGQGFDIATAVCKNVVAPAEMFQLYKDDTELADDGYRLRFKNPEVASLGLFGWLQDPVVLQPVVGGYLVVTKWGAEAYLPEFINAAQN